MDTNTKNKLNEVVSLQLQSLMQKELSAIKNDILSEVTSIRKHVTKAGERDSSLVKALNLERQRLTNDLNKHCNITKDKIDAAVEQIKDLSHPISSDRAHRDRTLANATWWRNVAWSMLLIVILAVFMSYVHSSIRENQDELTVIKQQLLQKMSKILATQESLIKNRIELLEIIKILERVKLEMKNCQKSHESMSHEMAVRNQGGFFDMIERLFKKLASYL